VTPLRQQAEALAAKSAFLFKPATAVRVRFAMNDPTPWPPELPAGENPPPGALIDYYLPASAGGEVKLEILNGGGKVIRTYSSNDPVRSPDPATDPVAYNKLCQATPTLADCGLPLYWPAPPQSLATHAGQHRFSWDLHYDPLPGGGGGRGGGGGNGAVPHRTYAGVNSPWVAPGAYTVRLTVDGKSSTQPITVKMDPRVKETLAIQQIYTLTTQMEDGAMAAEAAARDARAAADKLRQLPQSAANDALLKELDALAPAAGNAGGGGGGGRGGGGRGGRGGGAPGAAGAAAPASNLVTIGPAMVAAAMPLQASEMPPTAAALAACQERQTEYAALMAKWAALKLRLKPAGL
jgi:hypothetical protein